MEILFENSYVRDKQMLKEIYKYYFFKRKSMVVSYIILFLCFLVNLLMALFDGIFNYFILVFIPLLLALRFFYYYRQVDIVLKRDAEMHDKEITIEVIATNEFIQNTASNGSVNKLEYNRIKSVTQTKNFILLLSKAKLIYIFKKDNFTKGTPEDFIVFLRNKGIKVK